MLPRSVCLSFKETNRNGELLEGAAGVFWADLWGGAWQCWLTGPELAQSRERSQFLRKETGVVARSWIEVTTCFIKSNV